MKTGKTYKHINSTDIAAEVLSVVETNTHLDISCNWLNIVNPNNIFLIGFDKVKIKVNDLNNWIEIKKEEHD